LSASGVPLNAENTAETFDTLKVAFGEHTVGRIQAFQ
jgi:hypothetical protein